MSTKSATVRLMVPNETTQEAIQDAKSKKDVKSFDSTDKLFEDLDI